MDISAVLQEYLNEQRREHPELFEQIERMEAIEKSKKYKPTIDKVQEVCCLLQKFKVLFYFAEIDEDYLYLINNMLDELKRSLNEDIKFYAKLYLGDENALGDGFSAGFGGSE